MNAHGGRTSRTAGVVMSMAQVLYPPREHAKAKGVKMGRLPKLTAHQAIRRSDHGEETLAEIGHSANVPGWTIARFVKERISL